MSLAPAFGPTAEETLEAVQARLRELSELPGTPRKPLRRELADALCDVDAIIERYMVTGARAAVPRGR